MTQAFIQRLQPAPLNGGFKMDGYWVWCGSPIRGEDGRYHMFASCWPQSLPFFGGYLQASEVVRAVSSTPEGPYSFAEVVLPKRGPEFWDGLITHNPTIHKWKDTFLLFYIGSGSDYDHIRIGLATAPSVYGPWKRLNKPILEPRPGRWDSTVVTNPAPCVLPDGKVLLVYRSNTPEGLRLGAAMAANFEAPFCRISDDPVIRLPGGHHVEDPYIWHTDGYFEMLAKDWTGLTGEKGAGLHVYSNDGVAWKLFDFPKAYSRKVLWADGSTTEQGHLERPQLLIQDGVPTHLFLATGDGSPDFAFTQMTRTWNMCLPLSRPQSG